MASTSTETDGLHQPDSVVTPSFVTATPAASSSTASSATEAGGVSPATTTSKARLEDLVDGQQTTTDGPSSSSDGVPAASAEATSGSESGGNSNDSTYECTICLETAKDAVVSLCGHLFCWPCLHQWLETRPQRQMCPVCKAAISKDKVIPLYGRDSKNQQDPRTKAPPRPTAQRTEPETSTFHGFGFPDGGGFHMSFGIGAFPFGFFTSSFNFGSEARPPNPSEEEQFLSKLFLWVGILFLAWLILA